MQFAIQQVTNIGAAILGGVVATWIASAIGLPPGGPGTYRIILVIMTILLVAGLVTVLRLTDDRPSRTGPPPAAPRGRAGRVPADPRRSRAILGITIRDRERFAKLVIPGFLISIGAGQVIPFLNLYVQRKFGLDLAQLNAVFAFTSLGTVRRDPAPAAAGPAVRADHLGRHRPGRRIPFLVVLGFSPVLWTVIAGDGRPELADERGQPDLQRVRHGAGRPPANGRRWRPR